MPVRVLVVDDLSNHRDWMKYQLSREGYKVTTAQSGAEALTTMESSEFDVALVDYKMANMDGLELLKRIRARWPQVPVILMTGYASIPTAVEAIKTGAVDFLEKPTKPEVLLEKLKKILAESHRGNGSPAKGSPFEDIVGRAPAIVQAVELAKSAATTDKPVLIHGEIGTGRELLARAIQKAGPRRDGPFIAVRCLTAGPAIENELFGILASPQVGKLQEANGGTIYIDEVAELPLDAQAKLLRFLQDGEIVRSPTAPPAHGDARVIASTSQNLDDLVTNGKLRPELYLRLKGILIRIPALRERLGDIPLLVQFYSRRLKSRSGSPVRFTKEALALLATLEYPGNLRELEDLVTQSVALARDGEVSEQTLAALGIDSEAPVSTDSTMRGHLELEEKRVIQDELQRNPHNLKQVARNLKISRTTLWRKMKRYGLETG